MAKKLKDVHPLCAEILDGKYDEVLDALKQACSARLKMRFRKGMRVRLTGTKNPTLDGKVGVVLKVNPTRVSVGLGEATTDRFGTTYAEGEYNVPPQMLEVV